MLKFSRLPFLVFLLFVSSALAQDAAPQGTDQHEEKLSGINTVVIPPIRG
jgi:hypothetical protein